MHLKPSHSSSLPSSMDYSREPILPYCRRCSPELQQFHSWGEANDLSEQYITEDHSKLPEMPCYISTQRPAYLAVWQRGLYHFPLRDFKATAVMYKNLFHMYIYTLWDLYSTIYAKNTSAVLFKNYKQNLVDTEKVKSFLSTPKQHFPHAKSRDTVPLHRLKSISWDVSSSIK